MVLLTLMLPPTALAVVSGPRGLGASVGPRWSGGLATVAVPGRVRGPGPQTGRG